MIYINILLLLLFVILALDSEPNDVRSPDATLQILCLFRMF